MIFSHYKGKEISRSVWVGEFINPEGELPISAKTIKLSILSRLKAKDFDEVLLDEHLRLFISILPDDITRVDCQNPICDENVKHSFRDFIGH